MASPEFEFEWDEAKSMRTEEQRGISFADAASVFFDPTVLILNARSTPDEERYMAVGINSQGLLLSVVDTWRMYGIRKVCRIISARKTRQEERRGYHRLQQVSTGE